MAHAKQINKANPVQSIIISSRPYDTKKSTLSLNNIFFRSHRDPILSPPADEDYN